MNLHERVCNHHQGQSNLIPSWNLWSHYIGNEEFPSLPGVHSGSDVDNHKIFEDLKEDPLHMKEIGCPGVQVLSEFSQMAGIVKEVQMQIGKGLLSDVQKESSKSLNVSH